MCDHRSNHMIEANLDLRLKIQRSMQTWCFGASLERMSVTAKMNPLLRVHLFGNWKHGLAQRKSPCLRSARSMWLTCFSLIRIDPAIPQSVAFVGWIFACWLCGHVFKCCKHVAMHFIVNVENLIQVMALMRSFFHFSPFCMSGVCWRYPHRNRQDNVKFLTTLECLGGYQCIRMSLVVSVLSNLPQAAFQEFSDRIHADHRWIWAQLRYCDNSDCDKWWQPFYWLKF